MRGAAQLVAATLLLAGCSAAGATVTGPPGLPGAHSGGTLTIGLTAPGSIDPGDDYEPAGDTVIRAMCDPLIATDPRTGELRPDLAETWSVVDGGQRIVLRLRRGLRYSDGSPVTAADVVAELSRVASADYASSAATLLSPVLGYPQVHGDVATDSDIDRRRLAGVRTLDAQSVEVTLARPDAEWLRILTSPLTTPVPRRQAAADPVGFAARPVCVGPYRVVAGFHAGDRELVLERSRSYRPADPGLPLGGRGYPDRIVVRVYPTAAAAAAAAAAGQVDAAPPGGLPNVVEYLGLPASRAPFDQVRVRRTLAAALDKAGLAGTGGREPATGFLPPSTVPVFHPSACPDAIPPPDAPDLRGLTVPYYYDDDGKNRALVQAVAAQLRARLGLQLVLVPLSFADYLARGQSVSGFDGLFRFSWSTPFADPFMSLAPLFATNGIGRDNLSRFSDPLVDDLLQTRVPRADDPADRTTDLRRVEAELCRQLPMVPLTFASPRPVVGSRVGSALAQALDVGTGELLLRALYRR